MISPAGTTAVELDRRLTFGPYSYPFTVCSGPGAWENLAGIAAELEADLFVLVADAGLPAEIRMAVLGCLQESAPVTVCEAVPGEQNKTVDAAVAVISAAHRAGATRRTVVVALGGGQAGNIAGLAAALLFRGAVRLLHLPTTMLALSDSVVSRKQAANHGAKNNVGAFKTPHMVWVNLQVLRSLPRIETWSGMCEGAKNLMAILPDRIPEFLDLFRPAADYSDSELIRFIGMCLDAKQEVMLDDPDEKGPALVLEYGHTAGHVAELLCGLRHGLAIGVGGLVAARTAAILGFPGAGRVLEMHQELLTRIGAPVAVPRGVPGETWAGMLLKDNKRGYRKIRPDEVEMVLLKEPGIPHYTGGLPLTQVPVAVVMQAIRETQRAA